MDVAPDVADDEAVALGGIPAVDRWAVVIGVSAYADDRLNLDYAAEDARTFADLICTPTGGGFSQDKVHVLIDERASSREVTRALRSFLTRPARDDIVVIYLACHGGPDPRRPNGPLYLFTHDTEFDDIAGTAVPMDEIQSALRDWLLAERVVVIADTCHSGGLGGRGRRAPMHTAEATNTYLAQLADTKPGVALLTSCEAAESSLEGAQWGTGHGVFTWHLLEGMRGAADGFGTQRDGVVGVGELFDYVRDRVIADTNGEQHPSVGPSAFDRNLPMAITGGLDVDRHISLARDLLDLGWSTAEPAAFACAVRETRFADVLASLVEQDRPEAAAVRGAALLAAGRASDAQRAFDGLADIPDDLALLHGVALADAGHHPEAASALDDFARAHPHHREAGWAAAYASFLRHPSTPHALLIGTGTFELPGINLRGATNDASDLAAFLRTRLGFPRSHVTTVVDDKATRAGLISALESLAGRTAPGDTVVVGFSGHVSHDPYYIVTHETSEGSIVGIEQRELVDLLDRIHGGSRLLIFDSGVPPALREAIDGGLGWTVITSTGMAVDAVIGGRPNGALTRALIESWEPAKPQTYAALAQQASAWLGSHAFDQRATVIGESTGPASPRWFAARNLWRLTRARRFADPLAAREELESIDRRSFPEARAALVRALVQTSDYTGALALLAGTGDGLDDPELAVDKAQALVALGRLDEAEQLVERLPEAAAADAPSRAGARSALATLRGLHARLLAVGIDTYADESLTGCRGAVADAESFSRTVAARLGLEGAETVLLTGPDATHARILDEFDRLAAHGRTALAVFYFAGAGSTATGQATLLGHDARTSPGDALIPDIPLFELAARAAASPNLVAVIDAGAGAQVRVVKGRSGPEARQSTGDRVEPPGLVAIQAPDGSQPGVLPVIGALTLAATTPPGSRAGFEVTDRRTGTTRGRFTTALEKRLASSGSEVTWRRLTSVKPLAGRVLAQGPALDEPLLAHRTALQQMSSSLTLVTAGTARSIAARAGTLVDQAAFGDERTPWALLERGLALAALGQPAAAEACYRSARAALDTDAESPKGLGFGDSADGNWYRWAGYLLGASILSRDGDLNEATSALRTAQALAPDDAASCLYLAEAIQRLVERESFVEVRSLLGRYLELGAPLGRLSEIEQRIDSLAARVQAQAYPTAARA